MKTAPAIKQYLSTGENGRPTGSAELVELKKACSPGEWEKFGKDACEALGVEWEPASPAAA